VEAPRAAGGFVLVGVVMFVLALTILGMSLFSLSSYEAEFLEQTHDSNAALYHAQGGIEMALASLQTTWRLEDAALAVGHEGVISASAKQPLPGGGWLTAGPMNDSTVYVTVVAQQGNQARTLTARYLPTDLNSYYKRLFTCSDDILMPHDFLGVDHSHTIFMVGDVWQGGSDLSWEPPGTANITWSGNLRQDALQPPDTPTYVTAHEPLAAIVQADTCRTDPNSRTLQLYAVGGQPTYFEAQSYPGDPTDPHWGLFFSKQMYVRVRGTVILLAPQGVQFDQGLIVQPMSLDACLIIVANPVSLPYDPDIGIHLFGGVQSLGLPVILASNGSVYIEAVQGLFNADNFVDRLSVFANRIQLRGPMTLTGRSMTLDYVPSLMDPVIDALPSDVLPLPAGMTASAFTFVRGSWQDVTP